MSEQDCPVCHGARLKPEVLAVKVGTLNIKELTDLSIVQMKEYLEKLEFSGQKKMIADQILQEIEGRLQFLIDVGLDYLTLSRSAGTLSGGESQRIRLAFWWRVSKN